jgi:Amt family ammonium transporter
MTYEISAGDTAWVLISAALVLLMTPGSPSSTGAWSAPRASEHADDELRLDGHVGVLWVLWGYSMAFGDSRGGSSATR